MVRIAGALDAAQVRECRQALDQADWGDGRKTAGHLAGVVKDNQQLPVADPVSRRVGNLILDVLGAHPGFIAAALPLKVLPPMFNRYAGGQSYGDHIDNAIRNIPGTAHRVRTDLSATLFLSDPDDYDGGELLVADTFGPRAVKLPAGDLVLYPGTSLHQVAPVTRGARIASFFWIQSLVRDDTQRSILLELDTAIQQLTAGRGASPAQAQAPQPQPTDESAQTALVRLTGVYHNLLRQWSDT